MVYPKLWIEYLCRLLIICIAIMRLTHFRYWFCSQLPRRNFNQFQVSTSRTSTVEWSSKMASKEFNQSLSRIYAIFLFSFCLPLILRSKYQWLANSTNQVARFSSLDQSKPIRKREIVPSARSLKMYCKISRFLIRQLYSRDNNGNPYLKFDAVILDSFCFLSISL